MLAGKFSLSARLKATKSLASRLLKSQMRKIPFRGVSVEPRRNDLIRDEDKSILDDKYAKRKYQIFNQEARLEPKKY